MTVFYHTSSLLYWHGCYSLSDETIHLETDLLLSLFIYLSIYFYLHLCIFLDCDWLIFFCFISQWTKNLWHYFLRKQTRSFQTYPAYVAVEKSIVFKQNLNVDCCFFFSVSMSFFNRLFSIRMFRAQSDIVTRGSTM